MAGLSDSFTKLVLKIGENVSRKSDFNNPMSAPVSPNEPIQNRPGSPFIMLNEGEEGSIEFEYKQNETSDHDQSFSHEILPQEKGFLPITDNNEEAKEKYYFY